ncbi:MAG: glutaminase A, partial [Cyanobacteria bacterium P01_D01_bin.73]
MTQQSSESHFEAELPLKNGVRNASSSAKTQFDNYLESLHQRYGKVAEGSVPGYIPELALANPHWFGISIATVDGRYFEVGDCAQLFTIQSISKAFVYGLALEDYGRDYVQCKVSVEPTGEAFNSIMLDQSTNRPYNPMVNTGAIAITDLIKGENPTERLKRILAMFKRYTGHDHDVNMPVFLSERTTGHRNRAIAYLMLNFGMVTERIEETLDLYFQQCAVMVTARDLAMMAATLANGGVNPVTGERALDERYVQDVVSVMFTCGMYNHSGSWACRVGLPAKSGVGGGITALAPEKLGIGVFSPPLDTRGN